MNFLEQITTNPITPIVAQISGIVAMITAFSGLLQKNDKNTLKIIMLSNFFWIIHFLFMGIYSAVATSSIGIFRTLLSLKYKRNKRIFGGIVAVTIVLGIITYTDNLSILPIMGSCISAYGYFFFEKLKLRAFMFVSSLFWFTFNVNISSIGGTINEIIVQIILICTMYKMVHEEGKRVYFVDRIMGILQKKERLPDVGRFINIYDYLKIFKNGLKNKFNSIILKIKNFKVPKLSIKIPKLNFKKRKGKSII